MGIFFALLSPAFFGITNFIDKFLLEKHEISPIVLTVYGGVFAFVVSLLILILTGLYPIDTKSLLIIVVSGILTTLYLPPYLKALTLDETSRVVPLYQFYPIFVLLFGFFLFQEVFTVKQYSGSFLIILGGVFLSAERIEGKLFRLRPAFWYMMLSCVIFSIAQVMYKFGLMNVPFINTLPYEGFGIAIGAILILFYKQNFHEFKRESIRFSKNVYVAMGINESFYLLARYTGYFAISMISVGLVSVLSGFQPLFVLIYGIILSLWFPHVIKEVISKEAVGLKVSAIALMILGLYFIFL